MKKIIFNFLALMLICTTALGANFEIEDNPNYKHPVVTSGTASSFYNPTSSPVTFNNQSKGNDNFHGGLNTTYLPDYTFSWVAGASGAANDYAASVTAKNGTKLNTGDNDYLYLFYSGSSFSGRGGSMFLEFDLKLNTTTDRFKIMSIPLWEGGGIGRILFGEDGKVYGTNIAYSSGEWMHVKLESNFTTSKCNMWVNGTLVKSNVNMKTGTWGEGTRINMYIDQRTAKSDGQPLAGFAVDNILAYVVGKDISTYVTMNLSNSDGAALAASAPVDSKIKLTFPNNFNLSLLNSENIKLTDNYGLDVACDIKIDSAAFSAELTPKADLAFETNYTVKLSDEIRKGCKSNNPALGKLMFTTNNERDVVISNFSLTSSVAGGTTKAQATLTNNTGSNFNTGVMLAVYNKDNGLEFIKRVNLNLANGANTLSDELSFTLPAGFDSDYKVKLFVTLANDYEVIHHATLE